jgi:hypothetical protein
VLDIVAAYRAIPCLPDHKRFLVCGIGSELFLDHAIPFGVASVHYLLGEVVDAMLDIISALQKERAWSYTERWRLGDERGTGREGAVSLDWFAEVNDGATMHTDRGPVVSASQVDWASLGVGPSLKWVDDFMFFCYPLPALPSDSSKAVRPSPFQYAYDLDNICLFTEPLGVPWHPSKFEDFSSTVNYLGFKWDLPSWTVTLQGVKWAKYSSKVLEFLLLVDQGLHVDKGWVASLNRTLSHVCFIFPHGRTYLPGLHCLLSTFESRHLSRTAPKDESPRA